MIPLTVLKTFQRSTSIALPYPLLSKIFLQFSIGVKSVHWVSKPFLWLLYSLQVKETGFGQCLKLFAGMLFFQKILTLLAEHLVLHQHVLVNLGSYHPFMHH